MSSKTTLGNSKEDDKPAPPKKPHAAFFVFAKDYREQHPGESIPNDQVKVQWDKLEEAQRTPYQTEYQEALEVFQVDIKKYEAKYGKVERKSKNKVAPNNADKSDKPTPPKKPASGYNRFVAKMMQELKDKGETANFTKVKELWAQLDEDDKKDYDGPYEEEKKEYQKKKAEYEKKYGKIESKKRKSEPKEISKPEKEKGKKDKVKSISKAKEEKSAKKSVPKGKKVEEPAKKKEPEKGKSKPKKV